MGKYLLRYNGFGRVVEIPSSTTSEEWGRIESSFATECRNGKPPKVVYDTYADAISLHPDQVTPNGIPYQWELANQDGGWYRLLVFGSQGKKEVEEAKQYLRRQYDVVKLEVLRVALI